MKRISLSFLLCFFLGVSLSLFAQAPSAPGPESDPTESVWKGFQRYDFLFQERNARLIVPPSPLPGNPWVWRARFPDWHTEADSLLVSEGFHLVYLNTDNQYGSPRAMQLWDDFYAFLRTEYDLQQQVGLMGVSRGGLFVYNWARRNPEKVACIYAEAPVCDFKSWPGGFGQGEGSAKSWEQLKAAYGFASDEEAKAYRGNPVDQLAALAKAKVPLLHMIGLEDQVVPVEENTLPLINAYIRLGGSATVVPCTEGEQRLQGHHFPIETPRLVADFISYHARLSQPLSAADYHEFRGGLMNSQLTFEREKKGRVAFLGGSITYNSGWRDSVSAYLRGRFPDTEFEFIAAGIPSMGTTPAAFRLERDVLSQGRIDLLFEEAAVNDASNGRTTPEQIRGMEGIVRHLRTANPEIDIVMMHFVDPDKIADYQQGREPEVIANHNAVARHYQVPTLNLAREVSDRIANQEFSWEVDFKNLHPSPFGQGIYARSMLEFLDRAYARPLDPDDKRVAYPLPEKLDPDAYDSGRLLDIAIAKRKGDWAIDPNWKPADGAGTRANYVAVPMLVGEMPGSRLKVPFEGTAVGIAVAAGPDAGFLEYRIDQGAWMQQNLFTRWSQHLHLPWFYPLATGLSPQEHVLEIRIAESQDPNSMGHACRIRYFFVNGEGSR